MNENSDFYMILPSNASPDTHPTNTAADFTVSLQTPIKLNSKKLWKVALMDMTYSHEQIKDCGITYRFYSEWRQEYHIKLAISYPDYKITPKYFKFGNVDAYINIECSIWKDVLYLWSQKPFHLKPAQGKERISQFDAAWQQYYCTHDFRISQYYRLGEFKPTLTINESIVAFHYLDHESYFPFPKQIMIQSPLQLAQYMMQACGHIFHDLHFENDALKFGFAERVHSIKFCKGLGELLGFGNKDEFHATEAERQNLELYKDYKKTFTTFKGKALSSLQYSNHNIHIFSDICKSVVVGNKKIPLLKSISVDNSPATGTHGYVRNVSVAYPTYVDVRSNIISKVHIFIRNSANQKMVFQKGSEAVITLQFKCC